MAFLLLCLTGLPSIFHHERNPALGDEAAVPELASGVPFVTLDRISAAATEREPGEVPQYLDFDPDETDAVLAGPGETLQTDPSDSFVVLDRRTAQVLSDDEPGAGPVGFLLQLDTDSVLGLPGKLLLEAMGLACAAAIVCGIVTGLPGGPHAHRTPPAADPAAAARISDHLRRAPPGAVLLAGNSHAAGAADVGPPCIPWVNAGIGGATAASFAAMLDQVSEPAQVRLAVLVLGTNDILRCDRPRSLAGVTQFRADAARALAWLEARAARVLVAAVPPIGAKAARKRDPAAVAVYSAELRALCQASACEFVDPFADLRDGADGLARPGALADGIHLADYPAMLHALGVLGPGD